MYDYTVCEWVSIVAHFYDTKISALSLANVEKLSKQNIVEGYNQKINAFPAWSFRFPDFAKESNWIDSDYESNITTKHR